MPLLTSKPRTVTKLLSKLTRISLEMTHLSLRSVALSLALTHTYLAAASVAAEDLRTKDQTVVPFRADVEEDTLVVVVVVGTAVPRGAEATPRWLAPKLSEYYAAYSIGSLRRTRQTFSSSLITSG